MERVQLKVRQREDLSKHHLKEMRRNGIIPGSLYGKTDDTVSLEVGVVDLAGALKTDAGVHAVFDMKMEGAKKSAGMAVIKSIQKDPLTRKVLHVDFERVLLSDVVTTEVPVVLHGHAFGISEGGNLEQMMDQLEVKSRADHIPPRIDVDISDLRMGSFIHASDIPLPEGVELAGRPDDIVVAVRQPHVHEAPKEEVTPLEQAVPETETPKPAAESKETA